MGNEVKIGEVSANGFTFKTRTCGLDNTGELIIFLHGFPESSAMWIRLMKSLAAKNYRCFAFDQRGYSPKARPEKVEDYEIKKLASDVIALADTIPDSKKFHLVGHDWGSAIGWIVVTLYADRIATWNSLSNPHAEPYRWGIDNDPNQKEASQYIHNLLKPGNPELQVYWANDQARLKALWQGFPQEVYDDYCELYRDKDVVISGSNYYRAVMTYPFDIKFDPILVPTLCILGMQDPFVSMVTSDRSHGYIRGHYRYIQIPDADHWLCEKNFDTIEKEITEHLQMYPVQ